MTIAATTSLISVFFRVSCIIPIGDISRIRFFIRKNKLFFNFCQFLTMSPRRHCNLTRSSRSGWCRARKGSRTNWRLSADRRMSTERLSTRKIYSTLTRPYLAGGVGHMCFTIYPIWSNYNDVVATWSKIDKS